MKDTLRLATSNWLSKAYWRASDPLDPDEAMSRRSTRSRTLAISSFNGSTAFTECILQHAAECIA
eukprot:13820579-Alexandrium_andersonii.AAC.1